MIYHRGHSVDIYLRQRNFVQRHRDLPLRVSILISQKGFSSLEELFGSTGQYIFLEE